MTPSLERPFLPLEGATKPVKSASPGLEGPLPPLESATSALGKMNSGLERSLATLERATLPLRGAAKPLGIATEPLEETLAPAAKKMILLSMILDWAEGGDFCNFALGLAKWGRWNRRPPQRFRG